jgi:hypothetical protein
MKEEVHSWMGCKAFRLGQNRGMQRVREASDAAEKDGVDS